MQRPTAVTVFGILNIVFGVFAIIGMVASAAVLSMGQPGANPALETMMQSGVAGAWMKISMVLGGIAAIVEIVSGIGLLQLQEWGRKAALGFAAYSILAAIVSAFINFTFVVMPMMNQSGTSADPAMKAMAIGGAVGTVIGSCGGLVYPLFLLFFMTRPEIIAAFAPPAVSAIPTVPPAPESGPPEPPFTQSF